MSDRTPRAKNESLIPRDSSGRLIVARKSAPVVVGARRVPTSLIVAQAKIRHSFR